MKTYISPYIQLKKEAQKLPKQERDFILSFMDTNFRGAWDLYRYFKKRKR